MHYDSFEENIQVEEITPEEYEDWLESIQQDEATEWFDDVVRASSLNILKASKKKFLQ